MPPSRPPCNCDAAPRALRVDERGVSEVIGYILSFGILSTVLVIAMLAFNTARDQAEDRVIEVEASSIAHRVAAALVEVQAFGDAHPSTESIRLLLELPGTLEGRGFTIDLCELSSSGSACVDDPCDNMGIAANAVRVTSGEVAVVQSLLGVSAVKACVNSGAVAIEFDPAASPSLLLVQA